MSYYTFYSVYIDDAFYNRYGVNITNVVSCTYDEFARTYTVNYDWCSVMINVRPMKDFEDMFPVFPYDKNKLNTNKMNDIEAKIDKIDTIEARVDKIECEIVKLLSHVEAIMTVLQQRLPTDELLTL